MMYLLTKELSLQVAGTAIFILLRVDYMQSHVTPPYLSLLEKCLSRAYKIAKRARIALYICYIA
jgi:hypothetical protein